MRKLIQFLFLVPLTFSSCFIGADTYEKNINSYFWLYSNDYSTNNLSLGTIDYSYRIGDGYLHGIKQIGWDKSFMIIRTHSDKYYIQDLRNLSNKTSKDFKKYLHGPYSKLNFDNNRDSMNVDDNLDFILDYD